LEGFTYLCRALPAAELVMRCPNFNFFYGILEGDLNWDMPLFIKCPGSDHLPECHGGIKIWALQNEFGGRESAAQVGETFYLAASHGIPTAASTVYSVVVQPLTTGIDHVSVWILGSYDNDASFKFSELGE
jgi:hypothetical protein